MEKHVVLPLFSQDSNTWDIFILLPVNQWIRNDSWDILHKYFSGKFNINKSRLAAPVYNGTLGQVTNLTNKGSFFPQTIRDWNALPDSLTSSAEHAEDCVAKFTSLVRVRD